MGFFSYKCRGCGKSILNPYVITRQNGWMNDAVALLPNGSRVIGQYDGYGRIESSYGNLDSSDVAESADWWHKACWLNTGKPDFKARAEPAGDQGHFIDEDEYAIDEPEPPGLSSERFRELAEKEQ